MQSYWVFGCFRTPRLWLGQACSFKCVHYCVRTYLAPLFCIPFEPQPEPPPIKRYLFIDINLKFKVEFEDITGEGRQKNPNPKYLLTLRAVRRSSLGRVLSLFLQVNISGVFSVLFCPEMVNIPSKSHQSHPIRKSVRFYFNQSHPSSCSFPDIKNISYYFLVY